MNEWTKRANERNERMNGIEDSAPGWDTSRRGRVSSSAPRTPPARCTSTAGWGKLCTINIIIYTRGRFDPIIGRLAKATPRGFSTPPNPLKKKRERNLFLVLVFLLSQILTFHKRWVSEMSHGVASLQRGDQLLDVPDDGAEEVALLGQGAGFQPLPQALLLSLQVPGL